MELFWITVLSILALVYAFDRKVLDFNSQFYFRWTKIILVSSAIAIVFRFILGVTPHTPDLSFGTLLLVGWEDVLFSLLPIYYARKYLHPKLALITTILASIIFASGHLYQGLGIAVITAFYPYFVSYKIGRKYGYGTSIALHTTYDIIVYISVNLYNEMWFYL